MGARRAAWSLTTIAVMADTDAKARAARPWRRAKTLVALSMAALHALATVQPATAAAFGPRYLVRAEAAALAGEDLAEVLQQNVHESVDPELADLASASDDGLANFVDLGFSMPFYGNSRVRRIGVDPNGFVTLDAFVPQEYPCKQVAGTIGGSSSCDGTLEFSNVIAVLATDLWPGEPSTGSPSDTKISFWADEGRGMVSVLWENTKFYYPSGISTSSTSASTTSVAELSFALTLTDTGHIRFWYGSLLDLSTLDFGQRGVFAGLRGPGRLDATAATQQTSAELATQNAWNALLDSPPASAGVGFFVNPSKVEADAIVDMCIVPDWNLETLEEEAICMVPSFADGNTVVVLVVPDALIGCTLINGIDLYCREEGETDVLANVTEVGEIRCELPGGAVADVNEVNVTLVFKGADNVAERVVSSLSCASLAGPTLDYLEEASPCATDSLGEPGVRDCAGVCSGSAVLDSEGTCCAASTLTCNGVCAASLDGDSSYEVAILRELSGDETDATDQKVCCESDYIDCDGVCKGCTCGSSCECPLSSDERGYCPTVAPPTPYPTYRLRSSRDDDDYSFTTVVVVACMALGCSVATQFARLMWLRRLEEEEYDRMMAMQLQASQPAHLTPEEIEKYTSTVEFMHAGPEARAQQTVVNLTPGVPHGYADLHQVADDEGMCPVCICDFEDEDELRKLPCGHFFHSECIDEWFERSTVCPMCKQDVRGDDAPAHYEDDDLEDPSRFSLD